MYEGSRVGTPDAVRVLACDNQEPKAVALFNPPARTAFRSYPERRSSRAHLFRKYDLQNSAPVFFSPAARRSADCGMSEQQLKVAGDRPLVAAETPGWCIAGQSRSGSAR